MIAGFYTLSRKWYLFPPFSINTIFLWLFTWVAFTLHCWAQKKKTMALRQSRPVELVLVSGWGEAVLSEMHSVQVMGRAVLFPLPLTLGASSSAERHFRSLPSVCSGNVGTLQCLVSASMITQLSRMGIQLPSPCWPGKSRAYLQWQPRAGLTVMVLGELGRGSRQAAHPRRWAVMLLPVSLIVSD